ncbi:MAG: Devancosaminyl-vancomycin vancosaminetransferase, partial [uncultured Corynebacteriales bacterium]
CVCCCRRTGRAGTSNRWPGWRCGCGSWAPRCGCARPRTRSSRRCWPGRRGPGTGRPRSPAWSAPTARRWPRRCCSTRPAGTGA